MSSNVLQVNSLTKAYGSFYALDGCSLTIREGAAFGLLGPNGAGKTTLIRCVLGYLKSTSGSASVLGFDCLRQSLEIRKRVSYLPAESKLFRLMRGRECLEFFTSLHPRGDMQYGMKVASRLELPLDRRVAFMSTGMRQKLAIACVLGCPSPLMILDEPTANLDPTVRTCVLELVREARDAGSTIAFCSHVLSEIEDLCDEVAILRGGKVVFQGRMDEVRRIHRVRATITGNQSLSELPEGATLVDRDRDRVAVDFFGDMDPYMPWIVRQSWTNVQVEMVGLRSLYETHHGTQDGRQRVTISS